MILDLILPEEMIILLELLLGEMTIYYHHKERTKKAKSVWYWI